MLSQYQYGVPAAFTWQPHVTAHRALTPEQALDYRMQRGFRGERAETPARYLERLEFRVRYYRFFFLPPLDLALAAFLARLKERRFLWVAGTLVLFALGLNDLLRLKWLPVVIGIGGGLALLYMGVGICRSALRDAEGLTLEQDDGGVVRLGTGSYLSPLKSGFIASVANPFWTLWWFTIGILYVTQALQAGAIGLGAFYAGHILADLSWFLFVAVAVATGKRWLSPAAYRGILGVCGIFLVMLAAYFIYRGISTAMLL